jgi:hypothetical protein
LLVIQTQRLLPLLPCALAFSEHLVVQLATLLHLVLEETLLALGRVQAVLERLTHASVLYELQPCCQAGGSHSSPA